MLKEYTLKVVVQVGGETEEECVQKLVSYMDDQSYVISDWEITYEEVVEVERDVD